MRPSLSAVFIACDEEARLPRAIESVRGVADEVVVVDTGSTDGTVRVAESLGARVAHFAWCDDFSAAYNHANDLATGDWLLMLDADEQLLAESHDEVRASIGDGEVLAHRVLRRDLTDADRPDRYTEMWQTRLFRNHAGLRFRGRIHHQFDPPLEATAAAMGLDVRRSTIRLRHEGRLGGVTPAKHERNRRLVELELRDRPGQFYYLVELGLTRLALGESAGVEQLTEAARMVADGAPVPRGQLAMLLDYVLGTPSLPAGFPLTRERAHAITAEQFPKAIPLLYRRAGACHVQGRFAECARLLEHVLQLAESHAYDRDISFNPDILGDDARLNLAVCYVRLGEVGRAKRLFESLRKSPTRGREAAANLKPLRNLGR